MITPETSPASLKRRRVCPDAPQRKRQGKRQLFMQDDNVIDYDYVIDHSNDVINNKVVNNNVLDNIIVTDNILNENMNAYDHRGLIEQANDLIDLIVFQRGLLTLKPTMGSWKPYKYLGILLNKVQNIIHLYNWSITWNKYNIFNNLNEKEKMFKNAIELYCKEFLENPKYALP